MNKLLQVRNVTTWTGIPMELLADLPAAAFDDLVEGVVLKDPQVVLARS